MSYRSSEFIEHQGQTEHPQQTWACPGIWLEQLQNQLEQLISRFSRQQFKRWSSAGYFDRHLAHFGLEQTTTHLTHELETFFDEYGVMMPIKHYSYTKHGVNDAHRQTAAQLCQNFQVALEERGLDSHRAKLETELAHAIEVFLENPAIKPGSALVAFSPRGEIAEGYPGQSPENYVFVNFFLKGDQKTPSNRAQATLIQYLSWDSTDQLLALHHNIRQLGANVFQPRPTPSSNAPAKPEHWLISNPLILDNSTSPDLAQHLTPLVYQHQNLWPIKPGELPQLNIVEYQKLLWGDEVNSDQSIVPSCLAAYQKLSQLVASDKISPQQAEAAYDQLIDLTRRYLLKWLESDSTSTNNQLSYAQLLTEWESTTLPSDHQPTSKPQKTGLSKQLLKTLALSPTSALARTSSVFHCVALTPASIPATALKTNQAAGLTAGLGLTSPISASLQNETKAGGENSARPSIEGLSANERQLLSLLSLLKNSLQPISVLNLQTGARESHYIWLAQPHLLADYQSSCSQADQAAPILGPCGVELSQDDFVQKFDWPLSKTSSLSAAEYQNLLKTLTQLKTKAAITAELGQEMTQNDTQKLDSALQKLASRVLKVNFSQFVAGITDFSDQLLELPVACQHFLRQGAGNKLARLREMLIILETSQDDELINSLTNHQFRPTPDLHATPNSDPINALDQLLA